MITYKLLNIPLSETEIQECIMKSQNGINSVFPIHESNKDYQEYLKWLDGYEMNEMGEWVKVSEGNTPEPADE